MKNPNSKKLKFMIYMFCVIVLIFAAFNTYFSFQIHKQLAQVVSNPGRWPVGAYVYDSEIGFDFASNVSAPIKDGSFYVKSHQLGYRISENENAMSYRSGGVMSLGCSFTYGDEIEADQTFTQVIADRFKIPAYNYGVCSFSYIHAMLKAKKLKDQRILDKLQPKYLVLGCWKGLLNRSRSPFPPTASKKLPLAAAYITMDGTDLKIDYPLKTRHTFKMVELYRKEGIEMSFKKFVKIFFVAPRYVYLYLKNKLLYQKQGKHDFNNDVSDYDVYDFYFTGIEKLFSNYRTKIIVLFMPTSPNNQPDEALKNAVANHPDFIFVNGLQALKKYSISTREYQGKHPQADAHMVYALETIDLIRGLQRVPLK
ncbi:MAG: hypothetical protein K8R41_06255, partial [Bacteroidales bacterium]|nr:hypothetical protein [Bacteroidales bacterium]